MSKVQFHVAQNGDDWVVKTERRAVGRYTDRVRAIAAAIDLANAAAKAGRCADVGMAHQTLAWFTIRRIIDVALDFRSLYVCIFIIERSRLCRAAREHFRLRIRDKCPTQHLNSKREHGALECGRRGLFERRRRSSIRAFCVGEPLVHERDNGILIFRAKSTDCAHRPLKPQCTTASKV
jgi:hypothetical protein